MQRYRLEHGQVHGAAGQGRQGPFAVDWRRGSEAVAQVATASSRQGRTGDQVLLHHTRGQAHLTTLRTTDGQEPMIFCGMKQPQTFRNLRFLLLRVLEAPTGSSRTHFRSPTDQQESRDREEFESSALRGANA